MYFTGTTDNDTFVGDAGNDGANGVDGDDVLNGNGGFDTLFGGNGHDLIDGGIGADIMGGGMGNDTFVVDSLDDTVLEGANQGVDLVRSSVSFSLAGRQIEYLTLTGFADINAMGNGFNNLVVGNGGNNVLDGGTGADILRGGLGDDTYFVDNAKDNIDEKHHEGTDVIFATVSYSLVGRAVENMVLMGNGDLSATGNSLNNVIIGNDGDNEIDGGAGFDTIVGGAGNDYLYGSYGDRLEGGIGDDTYFFNIYRVSAFEREGEGFDTVITDFNIRLPKDIEAVILTPGRPASLYGNAGNNLLVGNAENNRIDGGKGVDTMKGGAGHDSYFVDSSDDIIEESEFVGHDIVWSETSYVLSENVEELFLRGVASINATGNSGYNRLTANDGDNVIDGRAGADTMVGWKGNDTYYVDDPNDVIVEDVKQGRDTVVSSISYTLKYELERLILTGTADLSGTGHNRGNIITGNSGNNLLSGLGGADYLDGGAGVDTLIGGVGNDTYVVDALSDVVIEEGGQGADEIRASFDYQLSEASVIENVGLVGTDNLTAIGNSDSNVLTGNAGINTLIGGLGRDTYVVQNFEDQIVEAANGGVDTVHAWSNYSISGLNVESLYLQGSADINGYGGDTNDFLVGNDGTNILAGGKGDDFYLVQNESDKVVELDGEGVDTVVAACSYSLVGTAVENLSLKSVDWMYFDATGNELNNIINGDKKYNRIDGGGGNDTLSGYLGGDIFVFNLNSGHDLIGDFDREDSIDVSAYSHGIAHAEWVAQVGYDTVIALGGGNTITIYDRVENVIGNITW